MGIPLDEYSLDGSPILEIQESVHSLASSSDGGVQTNSSDYSLSGSLSSERESDLFELLKDIEWDLFNAHRVELRGITEFWSQTYCILVYSATLAAYRCNLCSMRAKVYYELWASLC